MTIELIVFYDTQSLCELVLGDFKMRKTGNS